MRDKLYFQDFPVSNFKEDFVGFEEEVEMIKEGISSEARIIGLVADYGSGKSSIIELLKTELDTEKYDVVKINLLDPDGKIVGLEAHKRLLIQLANHKYKGRKDSSYIIKRINPNYKSIDISSKNKFSKFLIILSLFLFVIIFLYKHDLLQYINFLDVSKYYETINAIKKICNISGILGFIILFFTIVKSEIVCNYLSKDSQQDLNELDLIEISKQLIDNKKTTIIVIEDLDRNSTADIEKFIKELMTFYVSMENCKFIIAVTPEELANMSNDKNDNKYKPFGMIVDLPKIKNSDYGVILKELLLSKKEVYMECCNIQSEEDFNSWYWLSLGENMNLRRLKHRINSVIHLYMTLKTRFPGKNIKIETCIAIIYLKDKYEKEFNKLLEEIPGKGFGLKNKLEDFIVNGVKPQEENSLDSELYDLFKAGYIDHNCEMYCFNYSKYNTIFNVDENEIYNDYLCNRIYKLEDLKIQNVIKENPECIISAIKMRDMLKLGIPSNIFERKSIINYIIDNISNKDLIEMFDKLLSVDVKHINTTAVRLDKVKNTHFYNDNNIKLYIDNINQTYKDSDNFENMEEIRLKLLDFFTPADLQKLYDEEYPIITIDEIKKIGNLSIVNVMLDYNKINEKNIEGILESIDEIYDNGDEENLVQITDRLASDLIDYTFKNCNSISNLSEKVKLKLFNDKVDLINLSDIDEIEQLIINFGYSFEETEKAAISLLNEGKIDLSKYQDFVNRLPNIHECTLERLLEDDCVFKLNDNIINEFKNTNKIYGSAKFKIFKYGTINLEDEDIKSQIEVIYSKSDCIFNKYMDNETFLERVRDMKIYKKYDNHKFMFLLNCSQTYDLLEYAFENLELSMLNDYISAVEKNECSNEELLDLLNKYSNEIGKLNDVASKKLFDFMKGQSLKMKYIWIRKKANV